MVELMLIGLVYTRLPGVLVLGTQYHERSLENYKTL